MKPLCLDFVTTELVCFQLTSLKFTGADLLCYSETTQQSTDSRGMDINPLHGRKSNVFTNKPTAYFRCIFSEFFVFFTFNWTHNYYGQIVNFLKMVSLKSYWPKMRTNAYLPCHTTSCWWHPAVSIAIALLHHFPRFVDFFPIWIFCNRSAVFVCTRVRNGNPVDVCFKIACNCLVKMLIHDGIWQIMWWSLTYCFQCVIKGREIKL
jgi:hypothetical protein